MATYLTATGLALNFAGVLFLGLVLPGQSEHFNVAPLQARTKRGRRVLVSSWGAILLGFVFQGVALFV